MTVPSNWRTMIDWAAPPPNSISEMWRCPGVRTDGESTHDFQNIPTYTSSWLHFDAFGLISFLLPTSFSSSSFHERKRKCRKLWEALTFFPLFSDFIFNFCLRVQEETHIPFNDWMSHLLFFRLSFPFQSQFSKFFTSTEPIFLGKGTESGMKLSRRHGAQSGQWWDSDVITREPCKPQAGCWDLGNEELIRMDPGLTEREKEKND